MRHVLILRALGLGDFLTGVPAYRALRVAYPSATLTLAAPSYLKPLVGPTGAIDRLLSTPGLGHLRHCDPVPNLGVNLHGRGPESIDDLLRTGAAKLITHRHPLRPGVAGPDWQDDVHEVQRWCRLLEAVGIPADPADLRLAAPDVPPPVSGAVVIHPGAAASARRWPAERFGAVASQLADTGVPIMVTGSPAEESVAGTVIKSSVLPASADLSGQLDLGQLAALISSARLVISGDTGVAHLASAYGTPSVLLFGPTAPSRWGPPLDRLHTVLWHGSTGDPYADQPDPGLLQIDVGEVVRAARVHLQQSIERGSNGRTLVQRDVAEQVRNRAQLN